MPKLFLQSIYCPRKPGGLFKVLAQLIVVVLLFIMFLGIRQAYENPKATNLTCLGNKNGVAIPVGYSRECSYVIETVILMFQYATGKKAA